MDEIVRAAMAKWPNVPNCYGWLALDARGRWRIGAERKPITHAPTTQFIARNYQSDARGRWMFQNGPQRVFVSLEYTPYVFRLYAEGPRMVLVDQCLGRALRPDRLWIDDGGRFLALCAGRIGVIHDHDSAQVLGWVRREDGTTPDDAELAVMVEHAVAGEAGAADERLRHYKVVWSGDEMGDGDGDAPGAASSKTDALELRRIARSAVPAQFEFESEPDPEDDPEPD